ncbi:hypothetical protein [Nocardia iowensis]|uniref:hypothetical protein n=1 Tax=Nocardia iowensis TaxID=204891 RepID=UPI00337A7457
MSSQNTSIAVDPKVYYRAAQELFTLAGQIKTAVAGILVPGLSSTGGMAGDCPAVGGWAAAYTKFGDDVRSATLAYAAALRHFGAVLNVAGYNWDMAEYNGTSPEHRTSLPPARPDLCPTAPIGDGDFSAVPIPNGRNGDGVLMSPNLGLVTVTPNGRTDLLEAAAKAWDGFAQSEAVRIAPVTLQQSAGSFRALQAPEVPDIVEALRALQNGISDIFFAASGISTAVRAHRDNLVDLRTRIAAAAPNAFPAPLQTTTSVHNGAVHVSVAGELKFNDTFFAAAVFDGVFLGSPLADVLAKTDFVSSDTLDSAAKLKALAELPLLPATGNPADNTSLRGDLDMIATWESRPSTLLELDLSKLGNVDPRLKAWAAAAVKYGNEAGIDPRLVMSIILNEGARRTLVGLGEPWDDFRWLTSGLRNNSLGLTNIKEDTFDKVKKAFPNQFRDADWSDLDGNEDLAVKAAAYNLKRIDHGFSGQAPPDMRANVTRNEFLAAAYNAGDDHARGYIQAHKLGEKVTPYVEGAKKHYEQVDQWMCDSGAYRCN